MNFLSSDQLGGILRALIPGVVAAASHYGIGTDAQNTAILTAGATAIVAGWSAYTNSQSSMIQSVNNADNGVKVVPTSSTTAQVNAALK